MAYTNQHQIYNGPKKLFYGLHFKQDFMFEVVVLYHPVEGEMVVFFEPWGCQKTFLHGSEGEGEGNASKHFSTYVQEENDLQT